MRTRHINFDSSGRRRDQVLISCWRLGAMTVTPRDSRNETRDGAADVSAIMSANTLLIFRSRPAGRLWDGHGAWGAGVGILPVSYPSQR